MKMKTKIIAVFLALLCATPILSKPIRLRTKGTIQRGCLRMPSITQVRADYDGNDITVNIQRYTGAAYIYIYDVNGNIVGTTLTDIDVDGTFTISVYEDDLEGDYVLDEYGIRDWFDEKCTYKSIALGTVTRTFKIIGL